MTTLKNLNQWKALEEHQRAFQKKAILSLFEDDPERFHHFSVHAADILFDFSKNHLTHETIEHLCELAHARNLTDSINQLFTGEPVNFTEQRPALHTALRANRDESIHVGQTDVVPLVHEELRRLTHLCEAIHTGEHTGFSGARFTDVVNIGIGGSDLGPEMVTRALKPFARKGIECHFISNIDGSQLYNVLHDLNPETTLLIISSKSFATQETLSNAQAAIEWLNDPKALEHNVIAITQNTAAANELGIPDAHILHLWPWVGGRYSVWSNIGLPIALSIGMDHFRDFLAGANAMDLHFRSTPLKENMPVLLALISIWYSNFFHAQTRAVLPYAHVLQRFPAYLQQLHMESNGKHIDRLGRAVDYHTGEVLWGEVGCNGQHAFHQLFHQGTQLVPCDFIIPVKSHYPVKNHQDLLVANCLSQSQALLSGISEEDVMTELLEKGYSEDAARALAPHKTIPGNKPSNSIMFEELNPKTMGALIALYEHKVFVQSVIWDINPFDQWGVELGKRLGHHVLDNLKSDANPKQVDPSTLGLIQFYKQHQ